MNGHGEKLSRKREQAILALLCCANIEEAAQKTGVASSTLFRWQKDPGFKRAFEEAKAQCFTRAITLIQATAIEAVQVLKATMLDPQSPASVRVASCKAILDLGFKGVEYGSLFERIKHLEILLRG